MLRVPIKSAEYPYQQILKDDFYFWKARPPQDFAINKEVPFYF